MNDPSTLDQVTSGLIGIGAGAVLVVAGFWLYYGVIERRRQGMRNVAMLDAAVLAASQRQADMRAWPEQEADRG